MTDAHGQSDLPTPFEITLAGAILAIPYVLVRSIPNIRSHRAAPAPESAAADTARPRAVAASRPLA